MTEDEMVGWHHRLSGDEFEQAPGDSEGQGSLACCSPWSQKSWTRLRDYTTTKTSDVEHFIYKFSFLCQVLVITCRI